MKRIGLFPARNEADGEVTDLLPPEELHRSNSVNVTTATDGGSRIDPVALQKAERAIAGTVLADNSWLGVVLQNVALWDFHDQAVMTVMTVAEGVVSGSVPGLTVADAVSLSAMPGISRLASLAEMEQWIAQACPDRASLESYVHVVRVAADERKLSEALAKAASIASDDKAADSRAHSIAEVFSDLRLGAAKPAVSIGEAAIKALYNLAEIAKQGGQAVGISTGFEDLDMLLAGLSPGQLLILGARPGVGKTALALTIAIAAAKAGHHALMFSGEMKVEELAKRVISSESGVDSQALRTGALTEKQWESAIAVAESFAQLPFYVADDPQLELSKIWSEARKRHREGNLSLIVVDYLQLCHVAGLSKKREQEVAAVSRGLKLLAMTLGVPVLALSQLSRALENRMDKRPQLNDLRESGSIEQDADVVMFLYREEASGGRAEDIQKAEIIVSKQRAGPTGTVYVRFHSRCVRFANL